MARERVLPTRCCTRAASIAGMRVLLLWLLLLPGVTSAQTLTVTFDRDDFLAATGARDFTGPPPQSGSGSSVELGFLVVEGHPPSTLQVNPFSDGLADPNEVAFNGLEEFEIWTFPVRALGFDFEEAGPAHPSLGAGFVDSTFEVTVCTVRAPVGSCPEVLGSFQFNAPNSNPPMFEPFFVGIQSSVPFQQVSVRELVGGNENEFLGRIYIEFQNLVSNGLFDDTAMVDGWAFAEWSSVDRFGDDTSGSMLEAGGIPTICASLPSDDEELHFGASLFDGASITRLFWDGPGCQGASIGARQGLGSLASGQWDDTFSRLSIPDGARSAGDHYARSGRQRDPRTRSGLAGPPSRRTRLAPGAIEHPEIRPAVSSGCETKDSRSIWTDTRARVMGSRDVASSWPPLGSRRRAPLGAAADEAGVIRF